MLYRFHDCFRCTKNIWVRKSHDCIPCFVLWIECDCYHSKLSGDSSVFIVGTIIWFEIANQNNNSLTTIIMDDPEINDINTVKEIWIPMIHRFDRLMYVLKDMDGNIIHLNGEFELQLTIEDVCDQLHTPVPSTNQFSMIKVFGNNRTRRRCNWIILDHSISVTYHLYHFIPISHSIMYHLIK